ncbi:hypothetical protein DFA_03619 [Cavenderia fasciculata]|uniref:ComC supersandwich domain-containing protein n=1 Tax=Cavenderia fasciculata TaxID=261658 RepID=F4PIE1_CACFS|nr:uncharacterized protein DFA_03619 [Cavenderia fasciculata]EGG25370.1 hypothetical protein DFA_03619 [Cavenderia fasciculata]|eukprot:XP_004363221.1 hypothetical protein DFA_03619 [Cavenderia fasciculata]
MTATPYEEPQPFIRSIFGFLHLHNHHRHTDIGDGNGYRITHFEYTGAFVQNNGMPSPTYQLSFTALLYLSYKSTDSQVADLSLSLVSTLATSCPKLQTFYSHNDPTFKSFPNNIETMTDLFTLKLTVPFINGPLVFPSHPKLNDIDFFAPNLDTLIIDDTIRLPNLGSFSFQFNPQSNKTLDFQPVSFPKLTNLYIGASQNIPVPNPLTNLKGDNTFSPSLDTFPVIDLLYIQDSTAFPFTTYPPSLTKMSGNLGTLTNIPNIPVTPNLQLLSFNAVPQLAIPNTNFTNILGNANGTLDLTIMSSPNFAGPLVQETSLCSLGKLTLPPPSGVTSIPDCFWCYDSPARYSGPLTKPVGFTCTYTVDSPLVLLFGKGVLTGKNLGWTLPANLNNTMISVLTPNSKIEVTYSTPITGPPQPFAITLNQANNYILDTTIMEAGFIVSTFTVRQYPGRLAQVEVLFATVNWYIFPNITLDSYIPVAGPILNTQTNTILYYVAAPPNQPYTLTISNTYIQVQKPVTFNQVYPTVNDVYSTDTYWAIGSIIQFTGDFGTSNETSSVEFNNPDESKSICTVLVWTPQTLHCKLEQIPITQSRMATVNITINGFWLVSQVEVVTVKDECNQLTNYCNGKGVCNDQGHCDCYINQGSYYNNCSKPYPFINSGIVNDQNTTQRSISLFGDFGPYAMTNVTIKINHTMNCNFNQTGSTQFQMNCLLDASPTTYGPASVQLDLNSLTFDSKTYVIKFNNPSPSTGTTTTTTTAGTSTTGPGTKTPQEICDETTQYCYGHGTCDVNGVCQCENQYNPIDNCLTKFADNTTFNPNTTSPTTKIEVDGVEFGFEIVAIQEIGLDNEILKELLTDSWKSNITTNNSLINAVYDLVIANSSLLNTTSVTVNISFSQLPRTVIFGDQQLSIGPNSIKLAVSISGWTYYSNFATLRLVLKTTVYNDQSIEYDCQETRIDPFSYDNYGTLQYLRVLKDNVQFNGRFLDFALADGRTTYSQTLLINQTTISSDQQSSSAMIGITLPQCQQCILDPDFTPLLVVNDKTGNCSDDKKWKIIVGCVVGGLGLVAITVGAVMYRQKLMKTRMYNKKMANKLNQLN